jgi:ABC-type uncharacterized transport system substrate-binding protein
MSVRRAISAVSLIAALALLRASPAAAHPHVWIDASATFVFADAKLAAVAHRWTFDEVLSAVFAREFDKNRDKTFSPAELKELFEKTFESLKDYDFFMHFFVDEKRVTLTEVRDFRATIGPDGKLTYDFVVPLPQSVDPAKAQVRMSVYDDSYYIDVALNRSEPARIEGLAAGACAVEASEKDAELAYFGLSPTLHLRLRCP